MKLKDLLFEVKLIRNQKISFDALKTIVYKNFKDMNDDLANQDPEYREDYLDRERSFKEEINDIKDINDLIYLIEGFGYDREDAYLFIIDCLVKT